MIRLPPRSTLFPSRRSSDLGPGMDRSRLHQWLCFIGTELHKGLRSEEHTSELQSQSNLVCRLLLEKKKKSKRKDAAVEIEKNLADEQMAENVEEHSDKGDHI